MKRVVLFILLSFPFLLSSQCFEDRHNTSDHAVWRSCVMSPSPHSDRGDSHFIMYDLGQAYMLGTTKIWNINVPGKTGEGAKDILIDVSLNGTDWSEVGQFEISQGPGSAFYEGDFGPDIDGVEARYVLITILNSWDNTECVGIGEIKFNIDKPIFLDLLSSNTSCHDSADGTASVDVSGGEGPYDIMWSTGSDEDEIENLEPGSYYVTITDQLNNTKTDTIIVGSPDPITTEWISSTNINCEQTQGSLEIEANGGTGMYSYEWSNGMTGSEVSGLNAGLIFVTVTDGNNCTTTASFEITADSEVPVAVATADKLHCNQATIDIDASGSSQGDAYEYEWSTMDGNIVSGANSLLPTVDAAGVYTLKIINTENQCEAYTDVEVEIIPEISVELTTSENASCFGFSDGSASLEHVGGEGPFEYIWSNGHIGDSTDNLEAGEYEVTVFDVNGCSGTVSVNIQEPEALTTINRAQIDIDCQTTFGTAEIVVEGGTGTIEYNWSNGATGEVVTELQAGPLSVIARDENGCEIEESFIIEEDIEKPNVQANAEELYCNKETVLLNGAGSSEGEAFTYEWTTENGNIISGNDEISAMADAAGIYTLKVINTDNHCEEAADTEVIRIEDVELAVISVDNVSCNGIADGSATSEASFGIAPYTYEWSNGQTGEELSDVGPGIYQVSVTDVLGCTANSSIEITEPTAINLLVESVNPSTSGAEEGSISISVEGGTPPYDFIWEDAEGNVVSFDEDATGLNPGTYTCSVSDQNNCVLISEEVIVETISSIEDLNGIVINVFPNPVDDKVFVDIKSKETVTTLQFALENVEGKNVDTGYFLNTGTHEIGMQDMPAGAYVLRIWNDQGFTTVTLIKE